MIPPAPAERNFQTATFVDYVGRKHFVANIATIQEMCTSFWHKAWELK